ncbi:MAG TPA: sigma 54-interacting transcriptional regulator [Negativicutes bacterium]|nr:sigma 54-interacting transcriptional regulator [Negativicutes bacterium]
MFEFARIGSHRSIVVDVRIISASNRSLLELMQGGKFRKDLYYRLSVMPIHIPSLKERGQDVLLLLEYFKKQLSTSFTLTERSREALLHHSWEGNVRELRNYVDYLKYMEKEVVDLEELPGAFLQAPAASQEGCPQSRPGELNEIEWLILQAINTANAMGKGGGRQYIAGFCSKQGKSLSEYEIRRGMELLRQQGYIKVGQGRGGSRLTDVGRGLLAVKSGC